jgi:hypothetical protein
MGEGSSSLQVLTTNGTLALSIAAGSTGTTTTLGVSAALGNGTGLVTVESFSDRAIVAIDTQANSTVPVLSILIDLETTAEELQKTINDNRDLSVFAGFNLFNYDIRSFSPTAGDVDIFLVNSTLPILNGTGAGNHQHQSGAFTLQLVAGGNAQGLVSLDNATMKAALFDGTTDASLENLGLLFQFSSGIAANDSQDPIVADFFSFGFNNDGRIASERVANQIIRIEAEETGDNTSTFQGSLEYIMVNQLNIID